MEPTTVFVLLPVHNRKAVTARFIDCLQRQTYRPYHLVLIDDGSTDGTADMVLRQLPSSTVIKGTGNWWWAGCLRHGVRWLESTGAPRDAVVLIANDDVVFDSNFLDEAVKALRNKSRTLLLAQAYDQSDGAFIEAGIHVDWARLTFTSERDSDRINCFATRGLFLRVGDFASIGGFHPVLLPHYASDYEFTIRAHRKGYALATDPKVRLLLDNQTTGIRQTDESSLLNFVESVFSKRSVLNPIFWTVFILLACPLIYIPRNIGRVWAGFVIRLWRVMVRGSG